MNSDSDSDIEKMYADLQSKIQDCIDWADNSDNEATAENKEMAEGFRTTFRDTIHTALVNKNIEPIKQLTASVDEFISDNQITVTKYDGGRRRKSASSSSRHRRRRSSKQRGTQRKQKRRQRRASRRAY